MEKETHQYNNTASRRFPEFTFTIARNLDLKEACVFVEGVPIFIHQLPHDITADTARILLKGYIEGYNKGVRAVQQPEDLEMQIARKHYK